MWRARIGLFHANCPGKSRRRNYFYQPSAARWGVDEVMNRTPVLLQGCLAVVSLSLFLEYVFRGRVGRLKGRGDCGKVRCPKLKNFEVGSRMSAMIGVGTIVICAAICVRVSTVVLALLLMAGDVERNPGPGTRKGMYICVI